MSTAVYMHSMAVRRSTISSTESAFWRECYVAAKKELMRRATGKRRTAALANDAGAHADEDLKQLRARFPFGRNRHD